MKPNPAFTVNALQKVSYETIEMQKDTTMEIVGFMADVMQKTQCRRVKTRSPANFIGFPLGGEILWQNPSQRESPKRPTPCVCIVGSMEG